ncbi:uncharacterized protein STEHIDRAFT_172258 [Stereum hirsutum FP-91666 SS1]|uniref:uncharacterized protein n=1 Tax=Stereum hirsutum (strain FP-91666) TaxID=721885 RepID=UPI000444A1C7|nr:uncharacterized protein STEHIDRAFT_172258 [Stereum hirsutum FP-91666 SS1]EIM81282.1 hypothetical protein STEHIDRAFT_172258 [Stereum hirsutum FP-91666 SS1]
MEFWSFRFFRLLFMSLVAFASMACVSTSLAIYDSFTPKANIIVVTFVPGMCFLLATTAITAKYLFTSIVPRILVVECAWCVCMLPFILVSALVCSGLRDSFRGQAGHVPFEVIHALCWVLTGLLTTYASMVITSAFFTAFLVDEAVWYRDMSARPGPLPFAVIWHKLHNRTEDIAHHCLLGCSCSEKISPIAPEHAAALPALGPWGMMNRTTSELQLPKSGSIPVLMPTAMECQSHIRIGFQV